VDQELHFAARHAEGGGDVRYIFSAAQQPQGLDTLMDVQSGVKRGRGRTPGFAKLMQNVIDAVGLAAQLAFDAHEKKQRSAESEGGESQRKE
jgi:hypothetical protein